MSDNKFTEPTPMSRFIDFCFFSLPLFIIAGISYYNGDSEFAFKFCCLGWATILFDMVLESRSGIIQARKDIAELKELIKNK